MAFLGAFFSFIKKYTVIYRAFAPLLRLAPWLHEPFARRSATERPTTTSSRPASEKHRHSAAAAGGWPALLA